MPRFAAAGRCGASVLLVVSCWLGAVQPVQARRVRPLFEPTDLDLEETGVLEVDLQFGLARGAGPARIVIPDFEVDLGLLPWLEINLDGAYAIEGNDAGPFAFGNSAPDSLWPGVKLGLYDLQNEAQTGALALGMQLGPKLPVPAAHGVGAEGLLLIGTLYAGLQAVWNFGGFVDPAPSGMTSRPRGFELGVDLEYSLDAAKRFAVIGGTSFVRFWSHDPHQLVATGGVAWSAFESLELSLVGLVGFLAGGDRYAVLLGLSPKLKLFE